MAGQEAVWHVLVDDNEQGPLTKSQVLEHLRDGLLTASNLIWRPGFADWKSISEVSDFWQPPKRTAAGDAVQPPPIPAALAEEAPKARSPNDSTKWSLWKSANIGLGLSAVTHLLQIPNGRGFQFANLAHTASAATIVGLIVQIITVPLLFVLIAAIRNLVNRKQPKSNANALWGAITFGSLLAVILGGLMVYGEIFFSSDEIISGEFRKKAVADGRNACVQSQRSLLNQDVAEANIEKIQKFCTCLAERWVGTITYKQAGAELDAKGLLDLKPRIEALAYECR